MADALILAPPVDRVPASSLGFPDPDAVGLDLRLAALPAVGLIRCPLMSGQLSVRVVSNEALVDSERARWADLQDADSRLASPFFSPEFTACVAAVRRDVFVAVIHQGDRIVGFFPFQRNGRTGLPVGGARSNYEGVILEAGVELDPRMLLRSCGLVRWRFQHLPVEQATFRRFIKVVAGSPYVDLSGGFEAYAEGRRRAGSNVVVDTERKARKLAREVGALRFVPMSDDSDVLLQLLHWKSSQYRRNGMVDTFAAKSNVDLLERVHAVRTERFAGTLSALYAGDRLVAANMGMRSHHTWHDWFPAYDQEMGRYSPGLILFLRMIHAMPRLGLRVLEFGPGGEAYKQRLMTGEFRLAEGTAAATRVGQLQSTAGFEVLLTRRRVQRLVAGTSLAPHLLSVRRALRARFNGTR